MIVERAVNIRCGGSVMVGILHDPVHALRDLGVLFLVGGPQYRVGSHRQFVLMARKVAEAGIPVMRFDYRGMGDSEGRSRSFETVQDDIRAAVDFFLDDRKELRGVVIFGLCDAASSALMYCATDPRIKGLMLANPWVRTQAGQARATVKRYYLQRLTQRSFWRKLLTGEFHVIASMRSLICNLRQLGHGAPAVEGSADGHFVRRMERGMASFDGPILLLISGRDLTASEFEDLCATSPTWKRITGERAVRKVALRDADHTFSRSDSLQQAIAIARKWLLDMPQA